MNKLYLYGGIAFVVMLLAFYIRHLQSNIKELNDEKQAIEVQSQLQQSYITKVEAAREENQKRIAELMEEAEKIPDNVSCYRPDSFAAVIDKLH